MKVPSLRPNRRARIEIIPLIDIIFFLLATFVMVSTSMVKNQGIGVRLPVASASTPQERKECATISIDENGGIFFNKESVGMEQLSARLKEFKDASQDPKVFINGDDRASYGRAIAVLDEVRKLGISKVAIETRKIAQPHES